MEFRFTKAEEEFRSEVRKFIEDKPPDSFPVELEDDGFGLGGGSLIYTRQLGEKGWISITWPQEYGGQGRAITYRFILMEELSYHRAPQALHFFNVSVGSSIILHGTMKQKQTLLPKMATGEIIFCTALSEPDAGSDLFATKTTATRKNGDYIINGQKVWITQAHRSDWTLILARTGERTLKHAGLSTYLVDLKSPGITVQPIRNIGSLEGFCEIFFDEVRVSGDNLLGQENIGLPIVLESLEEDRFWARAVRAAAAKRDLEDLVRYAKETRVDGRCLAENPRIRNMLAELAIEIEACRLLTYKVLWLLSRGVSLTYEASIVKTFADQLGQRLASVALDCLGARGQLRPGSKWSVLEGRMARFYAASPSYTIAGGTTEMQKLTIAFRGLRLPRV